MQEYYMSFPTSVYLVPSPTLSDRLYEYDQNKEYQHLPQTVDQILFDLQQMNAQYAVPVTVSSNQRGQPRLMIYTMFYRICLYPSSGGGGYSISHIDPIRLGDHTTLAKGKLLLRVSSWNLSQQLQLIPSEANNCWAAIQNAWQQLQAQREQSLSLQKAARSIHHENYLNMVNDLIEVVQKMEIDKAALTASVAYGHITSTGEERVRPNDIYEFHLLGSSPFSVDERVCLQENVKLKGTIITLEDKKMRVRFLRPLDWNTLPRTGTFILPPKETIFRKQLDAVKKIRDGEAVNKYLLQILVDRHYQAYVPAHYSAHLDPEQQDALNRALTVPDLLLVLGPPGTGKTRTITEIVCAQNATDYRKPTLITSKTHKAVDNVLERLPAHLLVIRFGIEDKVSSTIKTNFVEVQAKTLQDHLQQAAQKQLLSMADIVKHKDYFDQQTRRIIEYAERFAQNENSRQQAEHQKQQREQIIDQFLVPRIQRTLKLLEHFQESITAFRRKIPQLLWKKRHAESRAGSSLPGIFFSWRARSLARTIRLSQNMLGTLTQHHQAAKQDYQQIWNERQKLLEKDTQYQHCLSVYRYYTRMTQQSREQARQIAEEVQTTLLPLITPWPWTENPDAGEFRRFVQHVNNQRALLERRIQLLQDWEQELSRGNEQFIPALLHYADVIGATCIGVATNELLDGVEFDLAIVDEAGQICLPDLLVPLVRAKRAVLVGDHKQLPPFVDNEVQAWLNSCTSQQKQALGFEDDDNGGELMQELLTKSTFEQLFTEHPDAEHTVSFKKQRRSPRAIADFVSAHFYDHQLITVDTAKSDKTSLFFHQPLVFIDTSREPLAQRTERKPGHKDDDPEGWGKTGYYNPLEINIIADIVHRYHREKLDWIVIAPYKEQARRISARIGEVVEESEGDIAEKIATVDSFQGGERDIVLYSFTRSNSRGSVGFLKELRRLNVAMTRARTQLILVGDISTLKNARNREFRELLTSLEQYVRSYGEWLSYEQYKDITRHS